MPERGERRRRMSSPEIIRETLNLSLYGREPRSRLIAWAGPRFPVCPPQGRCCCMFVTEVLVNITLPRCWDWHDTTRQDGAQQDLF